MVYVTSHNATMTINPLTGKQIWKVDIELPQVVFKHACCGILNRGVGTDDGQIYRSALDAQVVALDAKTGKLRWKRKAADYQDGHAMTSAPLIANGVVMTGTDDPEPDLVHGAPATPARGTCKCGGATIFTAAR